MSKLSRIRHHFGDYGDVNRLEMVGSGYVSGSGPFGRSLCIKTHQEKGKRCIKLEENVARSTEEEFLSYVNELLTERGLYMTYLKYTPKGWGGLRPHRLEGTFYREKQPSQNSS